MRKILNIREWLHTKHNEEIVKQAQARLEAKRASIFINVKTGKPVMIGFTPSNNEKIKNRIIIGR